MKSLALILSLCFSTIAMSQLITDSEVTFYSQNDYLNKIRSVGVGESQSTGFPTTVQSIVVPNKYEVWLYPEAGHNGNCLRLSEGLYPILPSKSISDGVGFRVKSYRIKKHEESTPIVTLNYYDSSSGPYGGGGYIQNVTMGKYTERELINGIKVDVSNTKYNSYSYLIKSIIIPKKTKVYLVGDKGSLIFENFQGNSPKKTIVLDNDMRNALGNLVELSVTPPKFKIKSVSLEKTNETIVESSQKLGGDATITNNAYSASGGATKATSTEVSMSTSNDISQTSGYEFAVGAEVSVGASVTTNASPFGVGVDAEASITFSTSVSTAIQKSFTTGKSATESSSYSISDVCEVNCPARTNCHLDLKVESKKITYQATTTFVELDINDNEVAGSTKTVKSTVTLDAATSAECIIGSEEQLGDDIEKMLDEDKYYEVVSYYDFEEETEYFNTESWIIKEHGSQDYEHVGRILSHRYYKAYETTHGEDVAEADLTPLCLLKKREGDNKYKYATISENSNYYNTAKNNNYRKVKTIGYIYKKSDAHADLQPLYIYSLGDNSYYTSNQEEIEIGGVSLDKPLEIIGYILQPQY